ncbi:MAG: LytTR family transcriptional regulator [Rhodobacter sp.]|nr:LytTR family transcriptional regulator [Rhodobacter sp.]MCA3492897.1 LytTR family transcriptional regulator [Rhodobacter sp.]MCA3501442.1 LytTR family transcriptional regulator [Rhodobacter sp.]MCA3506503.1 LytTR family transcriptional regulator [Rhodobacter sp.]MCA3517152.1 LytTR family transcriptional regulator [Rhodobacter sp.]
MKQQSLFDTLGRMGTRIDPRTSWVGYLCASGATLALGITLLNPSVSQDLAFLERLVFWFVHVALAIVILEGVQIIIGRFRVAAKLPPLLLVLAGGVIGALVFAALSLFALEQLIWLPAPNLGGDDATIMEFFKEFRSSGGQVVLFWVLLNAPRLLMLSQQQNDGQETVQPRTDGPAEADKGKVDPDLVELLARIPVNLGRDIVALSAELHYLRVYTTQGNTLILMSFSRAVSAVRIIPGMVVHRSHWVALKHVESLQGQGAGLVCKLVTGLSVPVSRANRAALRAAMTERGIKDAERGARDLAVGAAGPTDERRVG